MDMDDRFWRDKKSLNINSEWPFVDPNAAIALRLNLFCFLSDDEKPAYREHNMDRKGVKRVCLALKGVKLDHPWGDEHDVYKIGGKMFAMIGSEGGVSFKVSDIAFEVLTQSGRARAAPYLARAKWVHLDDLNDWPKDELVDHLRAAYSLILAKLPKKLQTELSKGR
jgi:predicted DNA-binding protein (MmcQ/YjbR family)